jgi:hypothetical protein
MYEMEKEMSEAIAKYTPFSAGDIFSAWLSLRSFDLVLRAIEFARAFGIATVNEATNHLVEDYIREQRSGLTQRAADVLVRCVHCDALLETDVHCDNCGSFHPTHH